MHSYTAYTHTQIVRPKKPRCLPKPQIQARAMQCVKVHSKLRLGGKGASILRSQSRTVQSEEEQNEQNELDWAQIRQANTRKW